MANIWDYDPNFSGAVTPNYQISPTFTPTNAQPQNYLGYYQPGSYGATQDWFNTPLSQQMREQNQNLAYGYYGNNLGIENNDSPFNKWFYNQFPRFQQAYGMASMENPLLTVDDFLKTLPGMNQLQQQYQMQSPTARGENYGLYAPTPRWMNR